MASIYERIRGAVQADGTLPGDFSIQPEPEEANALRFAEGAQDGIVYYHAGGGGNPALVEKLAEITRQAAAGGEYETLEPQLAACFGSWDGLLGSVDDLHAWVLEHRAELDPSRMFGFANAVLRYSQSLGAVKYALAVLELLAGAQGQWRETVRTLALADELTLYCVFVASRWENKDEELFAIAQKVRGWGRVHAVRELEPTTREMQVWLLDEGWDNDVLPSYTALHCARAGGLRRRLERETLSRARLDAADGLIRALLDEGPVRNISQLEDAEDLLLAWLDQLEKAECSEEDRKTLDCLRAELEDRDWPRVRARLERMGVQTMTELEALYGSIARLKEKGVIVNTYNGSGHPEDPDDRALGEFIEYIYAWQSRNRPDWLEALYQVLCWQFQTFHEGVDGYYENFYGDNSRASQVTTADYLRDNGYPELEAQYRQGLEATVEGVFEGAASDFGDWMDGHEEAVWRFCLDVLETHRGDWPEPEARNADE